MAKELPSDWKALKLLPHQKATIRLLDEEVMRQRQDIDNFTGMASDMHLDLGKTSSFLDHYGIRTGRMPSNLGYNFTHPIHFTHPIQAQSRIRRGTKQPFTFHDIFYDISFDLESAFTRNSRFYGHFLSMYAECFELKRRCKCESCMEERRRYGLKRRNWKLAFAVGDCFRAPLPTRSTDFVIDIRHMCKAQTKKLINEFDKKSGNKISLRQPTGLNVIDAFLATNHYEP